jgi:RimJ/RimL family protein N-acetyltransferase
MEWVEMNRATGFFWTIAGTDGEPLGFAEVFDLDRINRTLWTGTSIYEPERRQRGLGTAARRCLLSHVFYEMDYRRAFGQFIDFNVASWRSHRKLGGEVIGRRRRMSILSGQYHDYIQYVHRHEVFTSRVPPPRQTWGPEDALAIDWRAP